MSVSDHHSSAGSFVEIDLLRNAACDTHLIRRGPSDDTSNCFGWVFAKGRYWLMPWVVERILADNGYSVVREPRGDDVIVYRDEAGDPSHAGIVRGVCVDGTVMVEEQVGVDGRVFALCVRPKCGNNFSFYRTERGNHTVRDLPR